MAGSLEQQKALATDANGNPIQNILGTYGPNKDAGHPDSVLTASGYAQSWVVKFTNTASTITVLTGAAGTQTFFLKTGECYRITIVGAVITDKAFLQLGFGEATDPDSAIFPTLPAAGPTNATSGLLWSCCIDPNFDFKAMPGQKYLAVKVGPDAFASPATGGPWLCIRHLM
jgi:hypothetical protein